MFTGCVSYHLYHLEVEALLDTENEADILALHMTFLPKLQKQLEAPPSIMATGDVSAVD